jgi:type I restriction enzyme S subunit
VNKSFIIVNPPDPLWDRLSGFLFYWLLANSYEIRGIADEAAHGTKRLQTDRLLKKSVYLPPLLLQRKIAAMLSAYDDLIENNTRRIRILEEMARALYREWFVHFRFPGHGKVKLVESAVGLIPAGWEEARLGELADINAASIRRGEAPDEILYVDISSVSPGRIDKIEALPFAEAPGRARRIVKHGDIIWSCVRPNRRSYSLILDPPSNLIVSTGFAVISAKGAPHTYLYHALTTDDFVGYLTNHATGAAYPAVTGRDFENARIICPAQVLLDRFHEIVEPCLALQEKLNRKNAALRRTRDLLLPKLISGEVDVSDLDIDVPAPAAV